MWKHGLYANLKKCRFHQDEICFLEYVMLARGIKIEDKQIKAVRNWPEPKSVRDIQILIGFTNFYWRFIQGFSRIAASLTSRLKTTGSSGSLALEVFRADDNEVVRVGGRADETVVHLSKSKKSRNLSKSKMSKNDKSESPTCTNLGATGEPLFLTPNARKAFNHLRLAFTEARILRHFDPECHIWIKTNASAYAIGGVLS